MKLNEQLHKLFKETHRAIDSATNTTTKKQSREIHDDTRLRICHNSLQGYSIGLLVANFAMFLLYRMIVDMESSPVANFCAGFNFVILLGFSTYMWQKGSKDFAIAKKDIQDRFWDESIDIARSLPITSFYDLFTSESMDILLKTSSSKTSIIGEETLLGYLAACKQDSILRYMDPLRYRTILEYIKEDIHKALIAHDHAVRREKSVGSVLDLRNKMDLD